MEYWKESHYPQCIGVDFFKYHTEELIVELRDNESEIEMSQDTLPNYSDYLLAQNRNILQETELDKEFLISVNADTQDMDKNSDRSRTNYYHKNGHRDHETIGHLFQIDGQQASDQFETKYDATTGETKVKLGVYDYSIDISSCFTDAEKCLQQDRPIYDDVENEFMLGEIRCETFKESIPLADISLACEHVRSNYNFMDTLQMETTTVVGRYCVDSKVEADMVDNKASSNFTQLHSYNYEKHNHPSNKYHPETFSTDINDEKIPAHQTKIPQWTSTLSTDPQLTKCDINDVASSNVDQKLQLQIQPAPMVNGRHPAYPAVTNANQNSQQTSPLTNSLRNVSLTSRVPNRATLSAFSNPITSEVFSSPHTKTFMPKMTIGGRQKREPNRPVRDLIQPNKAIKRGTNLIIPYTNESLLTSSKIWNSNDNTNQKHKKKLSRGCKLWEFIRNLLLNHDTNPSLIKWEDRNDGTFKLVQSKAIAHMWGMKKGNGDMTYEKLSRAMRYYYKKQVFQPVIGKRLIYKFGPRATGWRGDKWS